MPCVSVYISQISCCSLHISTEMSVSVHLKISLHLWSTHQRYTRHTRFQHGSANQFKRHRAHRHFRKALRWTGLSARTYRSSISSCDLSEPRFLAYFLSRFFVIYFECVFNFSIWVFFVSISSARVSLSHSTWYKSKIRLIFESVGLFRLFGRHRSAIAYISWLW